MYLKVKLRCVASHALFVTCPSQEIFTLCQRRFRVSCPALNTNTYHQSKNNSSNETPLHQLHVSRDPALLRILSYVTQYLATSSNTSEFRSAPKLHYVTGRGGMGNQLNSMMALLLYAMYTGGENGNRPKTFIATFDDGDADCRGCTSAKSRYDGAWAPIFNGLSVDLKSEEDKKDWLVLRDINSALEHLWCSDFEGRSASNVRVHASQILPSLMRSSSRIGPAIDRDFGATTSSPLMFYLSRLLLVPPPAVKMEAASIVTKLRQDSAWLVGVHMRWLTNGRQYLLPGDMEAFVCACAAAAHPYKSTRFYVATDSVAAEQLFIRRLLQHNSTWQVTVSHASSNTSDGDTGDAVLDLSVLSECDDLIVTHHSSYSHLAASLGGHRPIVVGAHLSASYGVCNPQRAVREDSVLFSNLQQPRSVVMQQVSSPRIGYTCIAISITRH